MNRTIRKTFNLWIAWRARKRLRSVKGWQEAHDALLVARSRHRPSAVYLRAMQIALHSNMKGE